MSCAEFQAQLPALIEEGVDVERHPRVQVCALCHALIEDLARIARETNSHNREVN